MKIGELSKLSNCSIQTIRYYEKENLLPPAMRSEGNFRIYNTDTVKQLLFIKQCRHLDISLPEIKQLLALTKTPTSDCSNINEIIHKHIEQVDLKIKELKSLKDELLLLFNKCSTGHIVKDCGILKELKK